MARGKNNALDLGDGNVHRTKRDRPHLAQEFRDNGQHELREEMVRHLRPEFADAATGMIPGSHRYQPPPRGSRRDIFMPGKTVAPRGGMIG